MIVVALLAIGIANVAFFGPVDSSPAAARAGPVLRGVIHVHSLYSDGGGTVEEIAAAASRLGLDFVILTDHNTLQPIYDGREGWYGDVLVVCGTELSLPWGHALYIPIDVPPPPTDGWPPRERLSELLSDSTALTFVAHPSRRRGKWRERPLPRTTGIEIINANSEWRNDSIGELLVTAIALPFFSSAFNRLLDRPAANLALWDSLLAERPTVGIGSVDAHARIKLGRDRFWKFPSYEKVFGLVQLHLPLNEPLPRELPAARAALLRAIARGRLYTAYDALGDARGFEFSARVEGASFSAGDSVIADRVKFEVRVPKGTEVKTRLLRNGKHVASSDGPEVSFVATESGAYRVEVVQLRRQLPFFRRKEMPWIFSNAIYYRGPLDSDRDHPGDSFRWEQSGH
jgi:hypothetical protein